MANEASKYPRIGGFRSLDDFRSHLESLDCRIPLDEHPFARSGASPAAKPYSFGTRTVGNRLCAHPMEGWDANPDGSPSELTERRWRHFGESGCKLIWGGEAFAVSPDARANPRQLYHGPNSVHDLRRLLLIVRSAHQEAFGTSAIDDLLIGLQVTHSGRFCKPTRNDRFESQIAYSHPVLDRRVGIAVGDAGRVIRDDQLGTLVDRYVAAATTAREAGFDFVDIKACHGYLLHEFLSARTRAGRYGGDLEGRTRLLREIVAAVRSECPQLEIGVRLSMFDFCPFQGGSHAVGIPQRPEGADFVPFGASVTDPLSIDLTEPIALIRVLRDDSNVRLFNLSAGSPYYNPHILRPAFYPPSDGYQPPEDPLIGCIRQMQAAREIKAAVPDVAVIGSAFTYFQEYLPHVAQGILRDNWFDFVGVGRLLLSDWTWPARLLRGDASPSRKLCRTFSDCTTAPRAGEISGCYPLDDFYKARPEASVLKQIKAGMR
jgi:2,4-dienoyl-CoA reductase-like NADH-dependent reductase (Old Yellow Enzyme family)